jgi:hypothetical protein
MFKLNDSNIEEQSKFKGEVMTFNLTFKVKTNVSGKMTHGEINFE